jgi:long-chain acyl-CoA synthetase
MHPGLIAEQAADRPAIIMGTSGDIVTFGELNERSNQLAHLLRQRGLGRGDVVAILMENHVRYLEVAWAAQRSGLYYTTINRHLTVDEASYIVNNSGAAAVVTTYGQHELAARLSSDAVPRAAVRLMIGGVIDGWESYEDALLAHNSSPIPDECEGDFMLYSSGTTGRPKGIKRPLRYRPLGDPGASALPMLTALGMREGDVYLCPAPLYHSAPLVWSTGSHRLGATVVVMEGFDPQRALELIDEYGVTHSQWVPTMFVRMLKLPGSVRESFDLGSHRAAVHAAAPCPIEIKQQMIDWWGPILWEFYSATEGMGVTLIDSNEWLDHPGSVGRAIQGEPHIVGEDGEELGPLGVGVIWFGGAAEFVYHEDEAKTAESYNDKGWATVNDMGYLDDDGYLYLTDRKTFMIISGGVNIYPQEIENVLTVHPKVLDVAVLGVPNPDMGEEVKAVVQPIDWADAGPELEDELMKYCRDKLAHYKCPRSIDFDPALPRLDNGKLYKRMLRERYWQPMPAD